MNKIEIISNQLGLANKGANAVVKLLDEGATVPFIARYRKEMTGGLDEVAILNISTALNKLGELEKRKLTILKAIEEQGKLTAELKAKIESTIDINELEDIYLPYKKKRQTKAEVARKNGLEPLAKIIMGQRERDLSSKVFRFVKGEINSEEDAIAGAKEIIQEWVNENKVARDIVRTSFEKGAILNAKLVKNASDEGGKYKDYYKYEQRLKYVKGHTYLAIRRGESEGILKVSIKPNEEDVLYRLNRFFVKQDTDGHVESAVKNAYKKMIAPSIENEFSKLYKEQSDKEAIEVFSKNLRQLLLASPLGQKRVLAIDPGYRTGCKVVCLDAKGEFKKYTTIFPHSDSPKAVSILGKLIKDYSIEAIAVGNGTAGRETESWVRSNFNLEGISVFMVNEAGASIYSASEVAREEFPNEDVTVRGAISIGRRLMDPLSELVKIDAKSIGVGQYQHDVDQKALKASLDYVVESCVNNVGVELNTASKHLLAYVSGLGPQLAENIIQYRKENGKFSSRKELMKVPRMGAKAFEQCAGFLRIREAKNPLDNSAIHPEAYKKVEEIAKGIGIAVKDMIQNEGHVNSINIDSFIDDTFGKETLTDIKRELLKPGLDPRSEVEEFKFDDRVSKVEDLEVGMILPGIVSNITNFGAFVDVGVKQDGLVHISQLKNGYVSNPADVVTLNQKVQVKVMEVDTKRNRVGLSMKEAN